MSGEPFGNGRSVERRRRTEDELSAVMEKEAGPEDSEDGGEGDGDNDVMGGGNSVCGLSACPSSADVPVFDAVMEGKTRTSSSDIVLLVEVGLITSCVFASMAGSPSSALAFSEAVEPRGWMSVV